MSPSSVKLCLTNAISVYCPCPVFVLVRAFFGIPVTLYNKYILLCDGVAKLLVELFDLLVIMV